MAAVGNIFLKETNRTMVQKSHWRFAYATLTYLKVQDKYKVINQSASRAIWHSNIDVSEASTNSKANYRQHNAYYLQFPGKGI